MPEILEYFLFRPYSIALKEWILSKCNLSRYSKDENVLVVYATPARAFAKYIYPIMNSQQIRPVISFHLSGINYATGENNLGFINEYKYYDNIDAYKQIKPALVYKLTYTAVIRTILVSDMDVLLYQILTNAYINAKGYKMVDGQWMEILAGDPRDEINLEPGDAQDRIIRFGIDFTIPRAYLPRDYKDIKSIEQIALTYQTVEEIEL